MKSNKFSIVFRNNNGFVLLCVSETPNVIVLARNANNSKLLF